MTKDPREFAHLFYSLLLVAAEEAVDVAQPSRGRASRGAR